MKIILREYSKYYDRFADDKYLFIVYEKSNNLSTGHYHFNVIKIYKNDFNRFTIATISENNHGIDLIIESLTRDLKIEVMDNSIYNELFIKLRNEKWKLKNIGEPDGN